MGFIDEIKGALENVNDLQYDTRLYICKTCPLYTSATGQCNSCGCIMVIKAKLASQSCPQGKWK